MAENWLESRDDKFSKGHVTFILLLDLKQKYQKVV
jgi:hypothetical protein